MKAEKPCGVWESTDPSAGSFKPDPCKTCRWSREDHDKYWHDQDLKNEILMAVNDALEGTGFSIARSTIDGVDGYALIKIPVVVLGGDPQ